MSVGSLFDGGRRHSPPATAGAVGLSDDGSNRVTGREKTFECRNGEGGCAKEDRLHHFPDRRSFPIFLSIFSRVNPRRWSSNRVPSRWSISC